MKIILITLLVTLFGCTNAQVANVEIVNDKTLLSLVTRFIDTLNLKSDDLGVVRIEIFNLTASRVGEEVSDKKFGTAIQVKELVSYSIKASLQRNFFWIENHPPSYYFECKDRVVLLYTGVERFIKFRPNDVAPLLRKIKKNLAASGEIYIDDVWWYSVNDNQIRFDRREPW